MGLVTKEIEVRIGGKNLKYYENLGYIIPRFINNQSRESIGNECFIIVDVNDLPKNSRCLIEVICENCHQIRTKTWMDYQKSLRNNKECYCYQCYTELLSSKVINKNFLNKTKMTFKQWCEENDKMSLIDRWNYQLNYTDPDNVTYQSGKKFYFVCENGILDHDDKYISIDQITKNKNPNLMKCKTCQSLAYNYPLSLSVWSDKNIENPYDFGSMSMKVVWWKCENDLHDDFDRIIERSVYANFRCPICSRIRTESFLQEKVREYLNSFGYEILHENRCNIVCPNPGYVNKKNYFKYDNEVVEIGLLVETMGQQHFDSSKWSRWKAKEKDVSEEEIMNDLQWRDEYKRQYALSQNYAYLAIPYTADDDNETYKDMIDEAIYNRIEELNNQP
jgi:hypothetical protein